MNKFIMRYYLKQQKAKMIKQWLIICEQLLREQEMKRIESIKYGDIVWQ